MTANKKQERAWEKALDEFGKQYRRRANGSSRNTLEKHKKTIRHISAQLRMLGFRCPPEGLGGRQVAALIKYWTCHPDVANMPAGSIDKIKPLDAPLSEAYIGQLLTSLRMFAESMGKAGMILPAEHYLNDPALVRGASNALVADQAGEVPPSLEELLEAVERRCPYTAAQLAMLVAFDLSKSQAVMFRPHIAQVPACALPDNAEPGMDYLAFLKLIRGSKGIRVYYKPVRSDGQRAARARARKIARHAESNLARPGRTPTQSVDRISNVLRTAGATTKSLRGTPDGEQEDATGELFFDIDIGEIKVTATGGDPCDDPDVMRRAYLEVARRAGRSRPAVAGGGLAEKSGQAGKMEPEAAQGEFDFGE